MAETPEPRRGKPAARKPAKPKPKPKPKATARKPAARKPAARKPPAPKTEPVVLDEAPPAPPEPVRRRRSPVPYIVGAVIVVLLAAGGATIAVRRTPASTPAPPPPAPNFSADGFSVYFPSPPKPGSLAMNIGDAHTNVRLYSDASPSGVLLVEVMDLPSAVPVSNPASTLDEVARGAAVPANAKVLKTRHLTLHGDPALDMTSKGAFYAQWRFVLHGHRLFVLLGESQSGIPGGYDGFRDSFVVR
jgi:hypothetical protein